MGATQAVPGPRLTVAVLVKQVPRFEAMELGPDGRLRREGLETEMNPYCRRAVSQAAALVAEHGGAVVAFTLGPETAEDVLREAVAWAERHGVDARGVHLCDPAFAGSDTLATSRALAAAVGREGGPGGFDLVLTGLNSVDADTGQVAPQVAEHLDLPFLAGVRHLSIDDRTVHARCELDDGWMRAEVELPAVISVAERLVEPAKVPGDQWSAVPADRIRRLRADELGAGPWGAAGSPTSVGAVRALEVERERRLFPSAPLSEQVQRALETLHERGALDGSLDHARDVGTVADPGSGRPTTEVMVVVEPDRPSATRELLGAAAEVARDVDGRVVALVPGGTDAGTLWSWGADATWTYPAELVEEQVAGLVAGLAAGARAGAGHGAEAGPGAGWRRPWTILTLSTAWGREVASRAAVRLGAGLTGDAVDLEVRGAPAPGRGADPDDDATRPRGRLVAWKPAFGGRMVAAITASSPVQMVTIRPGALPCRGPRAGRAPGPDPVPTVLGPGPPAPATRVRVRARARDDDLDLLGRAPVVIGVGTGVDPGEYGAVEPLRRLLGAELGATRKVTDRGWLPRSRQIGITGRSIAPRLYLALGLAGKLNHMIGVRSAQTVLAVNADPSSPVFDHADAGIVADWRAALPLLVEALERRR